MFQLFARGRRRDDRPSSTFFSSFPFSLSLFSLSTSSRHLIFFASRRLSRRVKAGPSKGKIISDYFARARLWRTRYSWQVEGDGGRGNCSGTRDAKLAELDTTHKVLAVRGLSRGVRRTADRNLISLANEFLSKSRVSRLM